MNTILKMVYIIFMPVYSFSFLLLLRTSYPLAIIFFANNQTGQGIAMLIFGFGIIGTVDNVLRFTLLKRLGDVHPLTTVFGVIIGLKLFGFIGLIFRPLLISLFMLLLKIYSSEFITKQRDINNIPEI